MQRIFVSGQSRTRLRGKLSLKPRAISCSPGSQRRLSAPSMPGLLPFPARQSRAPGRAAGTGPSPDTRKTCPCCVRHLRLPSRHPGPYPARGDPGSLYGAASAHTRLTPRPRARRFTASQSRRRALGAAPSTNIYVGRDRHKRRAYPVPVNQQERRWLPFLGARPIGGQAGPV